jgi:hypothetical protein
VNGTEPTKPCCDGLFVNVAQVANANVQRWAEAGCFCIDDIINYDKPYFDKVTALAAKCTGNANLVSKVKGNCPTTLPANGFTSYANAAAVKAAVEAMDPKVPPGPPPAPSAVPTKKIELSIMLDKDPSIIGTPAKKKELEDDIAAKLGLQPGQVTIKIVSKGSTIITAEVTPLAGADTLSGAEVDVINAKLAKAQANTTAGAFLDPKYGAVKATQPAPAPAGAPTVAAATGKVTVMTPSPPTGLPPSIIGLPRTNPLDGKEYTGGFVITDTDYLGSLVGQGMAGFALAIILLIAMVLMMLVYIVSTVCGAVFCKCCNGAYKPRKFSKRDLLINKGVMFGFCVLTAIGCFIVFAETGPLLEGTKDLTGGMADTVSELSTLVTKIADTLTTASADPALSGVGDVASSTGDMKTAAASVDTTVQKAQGDIENAIDQGGGYTLIAAGVMFGITFLVFAAGLVGWYRLLILLMVLLSVFLILGWIVWGALSITAVLVDDLCTAMKGYLNNKYSSDLGDLIPCLDPKAAVEVMNTAREMVASGVASVNTQLEEYAGSNAYLKYLCYNYVKINIQDLCTKATPFFEQDYTKFTCEAMLTGNTTAKPLGKLHGLKDENGVVNGPGVVYAYPDAFCPYPTSYYSVAVGNFGKPAPLGLKQLRCPFTSKLANSTEPNNFGLAQCYTMRQIPRDIFDDAVQSAKMAQSIIDIIPGIEGLLQCKLVEDAFNRMVGPCDNMAAALASLWAGFLLVSIGYFCIWVSSIVVISRLRFYNEHCTDADVPANKV